MITRILAVLAVASVRVEAYLRLARDASIYADESLRLLNNRKLRRTAEGDSETDAVYQRVVGKGKALEQLAKIAMGE